MHTIVVGFFICTFSFGRPHKSSYRTQPKILTNHYARVVTVPYKGLNRYPLLRPVGNKVFTGLFTKNRCAKNYNLTQCHNPVITKPDIKSNAEKALIFSFLYRLETTLGILGRRYICRTGYRHNDLAQRMGCTNL